MTAKQESLYWRRWGRVRKVLIELGEFSKEDADAHRHDIHREALGADKSHKDFTNKDLDRVLDAFDAILVIQEGARAGDRSDQPVKRLIWSIEHLGLPSDYIQAIARDQFKTSDWRSLTEDELTRFRMTCAARASARRRKTPAPAPDPGDVPF